MHLHSCHQIDSLCLLRFRQSWIVDETSEEGQRSFLLSESYCGPGRGKTDFGRLLILLRYADDRFRVRFQNIDAEHFQKRDSVFQRVTFYLGDRGLEPADGNPGVGRQKG